MSRFSILFDLVNRVPQFWLVALCLAVFGSGLTGDFVMDDIPVIQENSRIADWKYLPDYFTSGVWDNTDLAAQPGVRGDILYRPLFLATLNLGHHLWGDSALGFHFLNLVLHCSNTLLVFYLIAGIAREAKSALLSAAVFAVHPVHVESIAWAAGLTDPLVSTFILGAILLYRRHIQSNDHRYAIGALCCFTASLLSKETAVLFPLLLVIHDWLFSRLQVKRYLPYLAVLIVYFIARALALDNGVGLSNLNFSQWPVLLEFTARYTQLLITPWPLEYYYDPPSRSILAIGVGAVGLLAAAIFVFWSRRRGHNLPAFGVSWIAITLLPALPIALMSPPVFAIRVLYLPSVGLALLLASLIQTAGARRTVSVVIAGVIVLFGSISILEISDWRDNSVFYSRAAETSPKSAQPYAGLAELHERRGDVRKAIELYRKSSELATNEQDWISSLERAAELAGQHGHTEVSESWYRELVQRVPQRSSAWVGLGNNALLRDESQQALKFYLTAYQADPNNSVASYNLALLYRTFGELEKAAYFEAISRNTRTIQGQ